MDKIIISMADMANFLDLLMEYGQARDHVEINNSAYAVKAFLFGEDSWLIKDLEAWAKGMLEFRQNPNP